MTTTDATDVSYEVIGKVDDDWTLVEGGELKGLQSFIDKSSGTLISLSSEYTVDTDRFRGGMMPSLEEHSQTLRDLNLHKNRYIKTLHPSVCGLVQLEKLTLTRCDMLTTLPDQLGNLKNLRELDLTDASEIITLPESIGGLQK
jgi:hypothetical protein